MTDTENTKEDTCAEIKMGAGWFLTINMESSEKYDTEYVTIAKERNGQRKSRFNLNPKYVRELGELLIKFADGHKL